MFTFDLSYGNFNTDLSSDFISDLFSNLSSKFNSVLSSKFTSDLSSDFNYDKEILIYLFFTDLILSSRIY